MKSLRVESQSGSYEIAFDSLENLPSALDQIGFGPGPCLIVTDFHVADLYLDAVQKSLVDAGWSVVPISVPPGESSKSASELSRLYDFCLDNGIDRQTPIIALGGGVVGDLVGYCASTILRGVPLIQVPTTLVAQIDSSIGGKTGINHAKGKNLIGAFYQPRMVYTDLQCLLTLQVREWLAGLAEAVKHALIEGDSLMSETARNWQGLLDREPSVLRRLIPRFAGVKTRIVSEDIYERGIRAYLNLGHTVGHAVEHAAGYGQLLHGEAVAIGMGVALRISSRRSPEIEFQPAWDLIARLPRVPVGHLHFSQIVDAMAVDKKNVGGMRRFVLLARPGEPTLARNVTLDEIEEAWDYVTKRW